MQKAMLYLESYALFRRFIRPEANNIFNLHNAKGIKLLARLGVGFSHLTEYKFRHNFEDQKTFYVAVETFLNQQHTFFFTVFTFLIKD